MDRKREGGFSLLEVGLALSVGILLTGASIYGYKALRDSSGDANMRQKVQDLHALVEELYAPTSTYPTHETLRSAWKMRRPGDYKSSPWGGPVIGADETSRGIVAFDLSHGSTAFLKETDDSNNTGGLYYIRIANGGLPGTVDFWDMTRGATVSATAYAVAGNKSVNSVGRRFFYVQSGR